MDFLFLLFFFGLSLLFILLGSWKKIALLVFAGVTFLIFSSLFILTSGVEVVNGTATSYSNYSAFTNETGYGLNTTINGVKYIANTYDRLPRDWEMTIVAVLAALSIYLLYSTLTRAGEGSE